MKSTQSTRLIIAEIVAALLLVAALTVLLGGQSTRAQSQSGHTQYVDAPRECNVGWNVVPSPNRGTLDNYLRGVTAVSANDIWAVGFYYNGSVQRTLTEHWDGTNWSVVPSPNNGTDANFLIGVSAVAANDVWTVGYYEGANGEQTLIMRWDGTVWNILTSPNIGTYDNELIAITALSANDAWAVGWYSDGILQYTLTVRWNGTAWSIVSSPNVVGTNNGLNGVSAVSSDNVWAVGARTSSAGRRTLVLHWNGTAWSIAASPSVGTGDNYLNGVAMVAANDGWAVGVYYDTSIHTLVLRWDGGDWNMVPGPEVGTQGTYLNAVASISSSDVWAVGYYNNGTSWRTLTIRWDGTNWNVIPSPNAGTTNDSLNAVVAVSTNDAWSVGRYIDGSGVTQTLTERYTGVCATPTSIPANTATPTSVPTSCSLQFEDVGSTHTFYPYVRCMVCRGIVSGYACGGPGEPCMPPSNNPYFRPNNSVTRGQIAKIVSNAAGFNEPVSGQTFQDVQQGSTFYDFIERLVSRGVMNGYSCGGASEPCVPPTNRPYFRTNATATRGQISKIVSNAAGFIEPVTGQTFQDVEPGSTFYDFVGRLASRGVMSGYPCGAASEPCVPPDNRPYFRPAANVTRGQTTKIVSNTFFPGCDTPR